MLHKVTCAQDVEHNSKLEGLAMLRVPGEDHRGRLSSSMHLDSTPSLR